MSGRRFVRGATTLKTQPIYAPRSSAGRIHGNPRILRPTAANRIPPRRITVPKGVWIGLGCAVVATALGWFLFGSRFFRVDKIEVVGSVTDAVRADIDALSGVNVLTYSTGGIESRLTKAQPSIGTLLISKGLPRTLRVEVTLRVPVLAWQSGDERDLVDADGTVFRDVDGPSGTAAAGLPLVVDTARQPVTQGSALVSRQFVMFLRAADDTFRSKFPVAVDRYELGQSSFEVALVTAEGWRALLDTTREPGPQLAGLQQVFERFHGDIHEYVDLRVPGRAYFK